MDLQIKDVKAISLGQRTRKSGGIGTPYQRMKDAIIEQIRVDNIIFKDKLYVEYKFHYKDRRNRDLDNIIKGVNDALMKSNIIKDDSQIKRLMCEKFIGSDKDLIEIKISVI